MFQILANYEYNNKRGVNRFSRSGSLFHMFVVQRQSLKHAKYIGDDFMK